MLSRVLLILGGVSLAGATTYAAWIAQREVSPPVTAAVSPLAAQSTAHSATERRPPATFSLPAKASPPSISEDGHDIAHADHDRVWRHEMREGYDARLLTGVPDPSWRTTLQRRATQSLEQLPELAGVVVTAADCSVVLCRLIVQSPDRTTFQRFEALSLGASIVRESDFWMDYDNHTLQTFVYLSRPGAELPLVGQNPDTMF